SRYRPPVRQSRCRPATPGLEPARRRRTRRSATPRTANAASPSSVTGEDTGDDLVLIEVCLGAGTRRSTERGPRRRVVQAPQRVRDCCWSAHGYEFAVDTRRDDLPATTDVGGDDRQTTRGSLHRRAGETFAVRRETEHVHDAVQTVDVSAPPGDDDTTIA